MIMSVSTLIMCSGAATASIVVNFSMMLYASVASSLELLWFLRHLPAGSRPGARAGVEPDMRKPMLAAAMLVLMSASAQAQDLPWCYRDFNAPFSNCMFSTAQQCFAAVGIMGGVCERNQRPVAKTASRSAHKSKARTD